MNMSEDKNRADKGVDGVTERMEHKVSRYKQRAFTATYFHVYFSSCPAAMASIFSKGGLG